MILTTLRKLHRLLAPWLALPLAITLMTGVVYRLGKAWFGLDKEAASQVLEIHSGEWLGKWASLGWVAVVGVGLLALGSTGAAMFLQSRSKQPARRFHRFAGLILLLPLALSAFTGMAYSVGEHFSLLTDESGDFLMDLHEGKWLGAGVVPYYILVLGLGLAGILWTGLLLTGIFRRKKSAT